MHSHFRSAVLLAVPLPLPLLGEFLLLQSGSYRLARIMLFASVYFGLAVSSYASPWIEVGDERTRHHLGFLRDAGLIDLPLTSWPLPWSEVTSQIDRLSLSDMTEAQLWSYRYLKHEIKRAQRPFKSSAKIHGSTSINPLSNFGATQRAEAIFTSDSTWMTEKVAIRLAGSRVADPADEDDYRLDGSLLAVTPGNWIFGIGAIDRWWGPGWQSSLILSNNARPAPGLFIKRKNAFASQLPVLNMLGPWSFELFGSQLEKERSIPEAKLIGSRLTLSPLPMLELGYSRLALWGGDRQSQSLDSFTDLIRQDNIEVDADAIARTHIQSNQLSSVDARISFRAGDITGSVYGQIAANESLEADGEDSLAADAQSAFLVGTELGLMLWNIHHRLSVEYANTENDINLATGQADNAIYSHQFYRTGFTFKGLSLAETAGTNARKLTIAGDHFFANGQQFGWRYVILELNGNAIAINPLGENESEPSLAETYYKLPLGDNLRIEGGFFLLQEDLTLYGETVDSGAYLQFEFRL